MCTVLFIPTNSGPYMASLRDENPHRAKALLPRKHELNKVHFVAPIDAKAGGTWAGVNEYGSSIILLNGGFEKHVQQASYKKSRGLIVLELLATEMPIIEWSLMDLYNIEPFTLIVWSASNLFELVWDGSKKHRTKLDATKAHIWSSSTLYNPEAKANKEHYLKQWIAKNPKISNASVLTFFNSYSDHENGFIINRNNITKTLSYSFLNVSNIEQAQFMYYEFDTQKHSLSKLNMLMTCLETCKLGA